MNSWVVLLGGREMLLLCLCTSFVVDEVHGRCCTTKWYSLELVIQSILRVSMVIAFSWRSYGSIIISGFRDGAVFNGELHPFCSHVQPIHLNLNIFTDRNTI